MSSCELLLCFFLANTAFAQNIVRGVIRDPSGAPIAKPQIDAHFVGDPDELPRFTLGDAQGVYSLPLPRSGKWNVCAVATAFRQSCGQIDVPENGSVEFNQTLQVAPTGSAYVGTYVNPQLGFQLEIPIGMFDQTEIARKSNREHATAAGATAINVLLFLVTGPDDKQATWHSLGIASLPREALHTASDFTAITTMSRHLAGGAREVAPSTDKHVGTFVFVSTDFESQQGGVHRFGRVYTTITQDQLLSFAFGATSKAVLEDACKILETLRDYPLAK